MNDGALIHGLRLTPIAPRTIIHKQPIGIVVRDIAPKERPFTLASRLWVQDEPVAPSRTLAHADQISRCDGVALPLCSRYFVAVFDAVPIQTKSDGGVLEQIAMWGEGWLPGGDHEMLGLWLMPVSSITCWRLVADDLRLRGIEQADFEVSNILSVAQRGWSPATSGATVVPSLLALSGRCVAEVAQHDRKTARALLGTIVAAETRGDAIAALDLLLESGLSDRYPRLTSQWRVALEQLNPVYALSRRRFGLVRSALDNAEFLNQGVFRAVKQHGCFASGETARSRLCEMLRRGRRKLKANDSGRSLQLGEHRSVLPLAPSFADD